MRARRDKTTIAGICLALTVLALFKVITHSMAGRVIENQRQAARSLEVTAGLESLLAELHGYEAAQRAYFITGDARYVGRRPGILRRVESQADHLRAFAGDPERRGPLAGVGALVEARLAELAREEAAFAESGAAEALRAGGSPHASDEVRRAARAIEARERTLRAGHEEQSEITADRQRLLFLLAMLLEVFTLGAGYRLVIRQFAQRRQSEEAVRLSEDRLRHDSLHDALTGLPNRTLFNDRVERCIGRAKRRAQYGFAVLFLDLDRFKVVNDSLGHAAGDQLLLSVARRLRRGIRCTDESAPAAPELGPETPEGAAGPQDEEFPGGSNKGEGPQGEDTVARLGGDEFTVLLTDLRDPADAVRVAERLQAELSRPLTFAGHEIFSTASIGIVYGGPAYETAKDLLRDADAAMYRAKSTGKARHVIFDATMHDAAMARLRLESDLRRAVERGEFVLHYQPIMSLAAQELVGFEALVRWNRGGELVQPGEFIPVAEDMGLIVPLGEWVLAEAARQLRAWSGRHPDTASLSMGVNVSRKQLADASLVGHLRRVLRETGLAPARLKLEITESAVMEDPDAARVVIGQIKALGVQLQMDDFGTGYSSLSCLHQFPLDGLKIDRAFLNNAPASRRDHAAVTGAIVSLAHHLGVHVVAEGVETAEQLALLRSLGCDYGQGFYFAKSLSPEAAEEFMATPAMKKSA